MPNYKIADFLENPENTQKLYGYCGKIARINLTTKEVSTLSTYKYVPKYVGGRMLIHRIFWDEVAPGTGAFDEGNKFIYMTGPTTGTGIPAGGRSAACAIGPSVLPEQFTFGNIGGWFASQWVENERAKTALREASVQMHFRQDQDTATKLARTLAVRDLKKRERYVQLICSLRRGDFLTGNPRCGVYVGHIMNCSTTM